MSIGDVILVSIGGLRVIGGVILEMQFWFYWRCDSRDRISGLLEV